MLIQVGGTKNEDLWYSMFLENDTWAMNTAQKLTEMNERELTADILNKSLRRKDYCILQILMVEKL